MSSLPTPSGHNNAEADDHGWTVPLDAVRSQRVKHSAVGHLDEPLWRDGSDGVGATELTARHWVQATSTCASASSGDGERKEAMRRKIPSWLVGAFGRGGGAFEALEERHWLAPAERAGRRSCL